MGVKSDIVNVVKKFFIQAGALLLFITILMIYSYGKVPGIGISSQSSSSKNNQPKTETLMVGNTKLNAEIANTAQTRARGLGGRTSLASDSGMLFVFDKSGIHPFWMKGMLFPLDFIWIKDQKVVDLIKNIPPPAEGQSDNQLPIYQSTVPVDSIIEVNAGFVDQNGIKVGDDVKQVLSSQ